MSDELIDFIFAAFCAAIVIGISGFAFAFIAWELWHK